MTIAASTVPDKDFESIKDRAVRDLGSINVRISTSTNLQELLHEVLASLYDIREIPSKESLSVYQIGKEIRDEITRRASR